MSSPSAPPTEESINKAITWYEANRDEIAAALPIKTPGVLYKRGCLEPLSKAVKSWKNGKTPLNLADCYIYRPIRAFYTFTQVKK